MCTNSGLLSNPKSMSSHLIFSYARYYFFFFVHFPCFPEYIISFLLLPEQEVRGRVKREKERWIRRSDSEEIPVTNFPSAIHFLKCHCFRANIRRGKEGEIKVRASVRKRATKERKLSGENWRRKEAILTQKTQTQKYPRR